jgi:hypothetical protein
MKWYLVTIPEKKYFEPSVFSADVMGNREAKNAAKAYADKLDRRSREDGYPHKARVFKVYSLPEFYDDKTPAPPSAVKDFGEQRT